MGVQVGAPVTESAGSAAAAGTSSGGAKPGGGEWAVLEGHLRSVTALACTTDGGYLVSGKSSFLEQHALWWMFMLHCRSECEAESLACHTGISPQQPGKLPHMQPVLMLPPACAAGVCRLTMLACVAVLTAWSCGSAWQFVCLRQARACSSAAPGSM